MAIILSVLHIGFRIAMSINETSDLFISHVLAEIIFLASASVLGLYYRIMSDAGTFFVSIEFQSFQLNILHQFPM